MKITLPTSFCIFIFSILIFNFFPLLYILMTESISNLYRESDVNSYLEAAMLFFEMTIVAIFIFIISYISINKKVSLLITRTISIETLDLNFNNKYRRIVPLLLIISVLSVSLFMYYVGFAKLLLIGSDINSWEFRMIGFDDTPVVLKAINETARRIFLPFLLMVELAKIVINAEKISVLFLTVVITYILGIVSTFDRAPMLTICVLFFYLFLVINSSWKKFLSLVSIAFILINLIAAITTYIQYNITNFSIDMVFEVMQDFFLHRVLLVPTIAGIQLSYEIFPTGSEYLYLKYSRLGALFGGEYIGTEQDLSVYVTPVGFIADAWRNGGVIFTCFLSVFLGIFSAWIDRKLKKSAWQILLASSFMYFALILFFIFGLFFSQGSFAQILFITFIIIYFNERTAKKNDE